jgi:DNA-binding beta-propeller fold protein YncE
VQEEERKKAMRTRTLVAILASVLLGGLLIGTLDAAAYRTPMKHPKAAQPEAWLPAQELEKLPFGKDEREIEGACGLAISPTGDLYVADYYHHAVHLFSLAGLYMSTQLIDGGDQSPVDEPIVKRDAICGLAAGPGGVLYGSEFHQRVLRLQPAGEAVIDAGPATGIATGADGDLYVDDRTYVAVYDAPVEPGEAAALKIGLGSLEDAYGVAVDSESGRVYVADAAKEEIKVFDPAIALSAPVDTIVAPGGKASFNSLANASLAVDESATKGKGHLLVVDNLEPRFTFPRAAVYEFDFNGTPLDPLSPRKVGPFGEERDGPIFSEPPGIAVDPKTGNLFVTTGNSAFSNVAAYGPYLPFAPPLAAEGDGSSAGSGGAAGVRGSVQGAPPSSTGGASASVVKRQRGVQVSFDGKLTPHVLPRHGTAPVGIVVDAKISATGGEDPPQLRRIKIAINRNGRFSSKGLPTCRIDQIQPSTTANALAACRRSLVGEGHFSANVKLPQQSPFPSAGKVLAFNGKIDGRPAILAHIYGTEPAPTSTVLPFLLKEGRGTYGTTLEASLPQATGSWGYVTGLRMSLRRRFSYRGSSHSYLSAGCPAPVGFPSANFPLAKTSFSFAGDLTMEAVLTRTCRARG